MSLHFVTVAPGLTGVLNDAGCIEWQGNKLGNGYGRIWMDGKLVLVHRLVLESKVPGFLESGYLACHTCDNPSCINPEHLVPGTAADNTRQMMERGRKTSRRQSLPGSGKLTVHQLREIQAKYAGKISKRQLAREYGVNQQTITKIVKANIPENWTTVNPGFLGEIQDNGCIIFLGAKDGKGYGRYRTDDGKLGTVSRAVLAAKVGYNLPYNIDACHTCDNPSCINPEHLWPGTRSQNLLDASKKGRTQGKSHPLGNAKLNWDKVQEIRRKLDAGARMKDLAEELWVARLFTTLNITRLGRWKALSFLPL
jgi:DNA-binding XRE family transcriptional regulator